MRWFRGPNDAPKLLSLSPLQVDEDLDGGTSPHSHSTSRFRDLSPVRWSRKKSSSSESERNCYNVQTSRVTTERSPTKKDKKKIQEERRKICEKRHPLLERVKNTKLSFFRDSNKQTNGDGDDNNNADNGEHSHTSNGFSRNDHSRRSVCESDFKLVNEETEDKEDDKETTKVKRKKRSKSHGRFSARKRGTEAQRFSCPPVTLSLPSEKQNQEEVPRFDSVTPSSCLAAKFKAMQDRYLKTSTHKLMAKIYKKDDRDSRKLRSFSYGALPGLDEFRTNPLFEEQDHQDDNDSGILDNDSANSSLLDGTGLECNSPPTLPPRTSIDLDGTIKLFSNLGSERLSESTDCKDKVLKVVKSRPCTTENFLVKLNKETKEECLGIFIAKTAESNPGYLVAHVVPGGLADKEGSLKIGDEILIVNGQRLRGLGMAEAKQILGTGSGPGVVDIVVSRYVDQAVRRLKESSVDYENVSLENAHGVIIENSPRSHFRKKNRIRQARDKRNGSTRSISSEKTTTIRNGIDIHAGSQSISNFCTLPRKPRNTISIFQTVIFEKGPGKKSLGFTIVGGRDSPKGSIGIFIKSVLPSGQAAEDGRLRAGDEILAVNGQVCHDLTHREAVQLFRNIKNGTIALHLCRRVKNQQTLSTKAKSCTDLLLADA